MFNLINFEVRYFEGLEFLRVLIKLLLVEIGFAKLNFEIIIIYVLD